MTRGAPKIFNILISFLRWILRIVPISNIHAKQSKEAPRFHFSFWIKQWPMPSTNERPPSPPSINKSSHHFFHCTRSLLSKKGGAQLIPKEPDRSDPNRPPHTPPPRHCRIYRARQLQRLLIALNRNKQPQQKRNSSNIIPSNPFDPQNLQQF